MYPVEVIAVKIARIALGWDSHGYPATAPAYAPKSGDH